MEFFENHKDFSEHAMDVSCIPTLAVATEVLTSICIESQRCRLLGVSTLSSDTPEILESCFACIFGKLVMTQVAQDLPGLHKNYTQMSPDKQKAFAENVFDDFDVAVYTTERNDLCVVVDAHLVTTFVCVILTEDGVARFLKQLNNRIAFHKNTQ